LRAETGFLPVTTVVVAVRGRLAAGARVGQGVRPTLERAPLLRVATAFQAEPALARLELQTRVMVVPAGLPAMAEPVAAALLESATFISNHEP
jgi:hypothetical protein